MFVLTSIVACLATGVIAGAAYSGWCNHRANQEAEEQRRRAVALRTRHVKGVIEQVLEEKAQIEEHPVAHYKVVAHQTPEENIEVKIFKSENGDWRLQKRDVYRSDGETVVNSELTGFNGDGNALPVFLCPSCFELTQVFERSIRTYHQSPENRRRTLLNRLLNEGVLELDFNRRGELHRAELIESFVETFTTFCARAVDDNGRIDWATSYTYCV